MNLEDELAKAFNAWSQARHALGELRKKAPSSSDGQFAPSPELASLYVKMGEQERVCEQLFRHLTACAERVADERQTRELAMHVARVVNEQQA